MMNKIPAPQKQQQPPQQQINTQPPATSQYNTFENVVPNQMPGAQIPGTQMPAAEIPPNMFKMQRGRSKEYI